MSNLMQKLKRAYQNKGLGVCPSQAAQKLLQQIQQSTLCTG